MIPLYRFGLFGGLGDVIIQSYPLLPYIYAKSHLEPIIVVVGDYICKDSPTLFDNFGPHLRVVKTTDLHPDKKLLRTNIEAYENLYLAHTIGEMSLTQVEVFPHGKIPLTNGEPPQRKLTIAERDLVTYCKGKPTICIANYARQEDRCVDKFVITNLMQAYPKHQFIQIGKGNTNAKFYLEGNARVRNAVDITSVQGALSIIDACEKLICVDSAFMCYGMKKGKAMDVVINNPEMPKYGFQDKTLRRPYFECFDFPRTLVYNNKLQLLNKRTS